MALLIGIALVAALGVFHHFGLMTLNAIVGNEKKHPHGSIIAAFMGLLVLHTLEILAFAAVYMFLLQYDWMGGFGGKFGGTWNDLIYFSGINFTTLGYSQIEATGPVRMINMMHSLGGFMVLTWSATFIYSIWEMTSPRRHS